MNFWRRWFRRDEWERELSDEMRLHIEKQIAANIAAGMSPEKRGGKRHCNSAQ